MTISDLIANIKISQTNWQVVAKALKTLEDGFTRKLSQPHYYSATDTFSIYNYKYNPCFEIGLNGKRITQPITIDDYI